MNEPSDAHSSVEVQPLQPGLSVGRSQLHKQAADPLDSRTVYALRAGFAELFTKFNIHCKKRYLTFLFVIRLSLSPNIIKQMILIYLCLNWFPGQQCWMVLSTGELWFVVHLSGITPSRCLPTMLSALTRNTLILSWFDSGCQATRDKQPPGSGRRRQRFRWPKITWWQPDFTVMSLLQSPESLPCFHNGNRDDLCCFLINLAVFFNTNISCKTSLLMEGMVRFLNSNNKNQITESKHTSAAALQTFAGICERIRISEFAQRD